jgi:hypothetical protein
MYLLGLLALAGLTVGLIVWKGSRSEEPAPAPKPAASAGPEEPQLSFDAPPPPPEELADAGADAAPAASAAGSASGSGVARGGDGPCSACGSGISTPELESAVRSRANLARGCYNKELQTGGGEGAITVALSVGAHGGVCSAGVSSDTVGSPQLSQCVVSKFQSGSFPRPKQGCVPFSMRINFKTTR